MRRVARWSIVVGAVSAAGVLAGVLAAPGGPAASPPQGATRTHGPSSTSPPTSRASPPPASATTAPTTAPPTTPRAAPPHVMVIVFENHGYASIIGSPTAPYLNSLARRYGLATASYATTHPSLPNYLALVSGSTQGITVDCTATCSANAPQLVDQLRAAHIGWRAFMEGAPSPCYTGSGAYPYDRHHDPFVYAPHIADDPAQCDDIVPYATLALELASDRAPPFLWVTPDVQHDMHTGTVAEGDQWLRAQLPAVLASTWYRDGGIVIVTFDEGGGATASGCCAGADGGRIATIVVSARTPHGARLTTPVDGAGILRTIESLYRLPYLGQAGNPTSGTLLPLLGATRS